MHSEKVLKMTVLFGVMLYVIFFFDNTQIKILLAYLNHVLVSCQGK